MSVDVIMPQMGESIAEGTVTKWLKKVGDPVKRDEPLFEISTDKVDAEIPSPSAGTLAEILVEEGSTVGINTVVARIAAQGEAPAPGAQAAQAAPTARAQAEPPAAAKTSAPETVAEARPARAAGGTGEAASREELRRTRSSPVVRKIAAEHNIDISELTGTGISGRVTRQDIMAFLEKGGPA
ncbi:MAG TPA: biotin/lipoyl-containing protein, partial [Candidatus Polarisedimenticolia bacterium]|nr:biotin/lipoyl-containing protein [Candidatus Polarisedimenticolia bacterium]